MSFKPSIPKGTRDFSTREMMRRDHIFNTIRDVFRLYGYQPVETPAMENLSTLLGKYGEEGDKLLFRILDSGDFLSDVSDEELAERDIKSLSSKICGKGLRYDLTVPFARFVVQHRDEITFPFKRYQIQPVWRADRPQKGRYREFFQCDADVIGSDSLLNEYELVEIIDSIFSKLGVSVVIKLNNRKILAGIAEYTGNTEKLTDITVALDKLDKIGIDGVNAELSEKGISEESISKLQPIVQLKGETSGKLEALENIFEKSETGLKGIDELKKLFGYISKGVIKSEVELDLSLARGLNYYTGAIIEVKAKDVSIGSICGGGRYDNLTGVFGLPGVSGVGVSFGADRIYDVMTQMNLFNESVMSATEVLVVNFGDSELNYGFNVLKAFRQQGIRSEIYPDQSKMKKQLAYADTKKIPYVVIAGENEIKEKKITVKVMSNGEQKTVFLDDIATFVREEIKKDRENH
ncbi:MAG TPA: histidine--tRNA ligase [Bacteroidales bacterium]|nr:histidine--tRNA ligase [Bacteroidales bacterium]